MSGSITLTTVALYIDSSNPRHSTVSTAADPANGDHRRLATGGLRHPVAGSAPGVRSSRQPAVACRQSHRLAPSIVLL